MLGSSEAWRTLLQTLRTRIFLSLSDETSAEIASKLCGQVRKIKATYAINESSRQSGINEQEAPAAHNQGRGRSPCTLSPSGVGALIQRGGRAVAGMLTIATAGGS